MGTAAAPALFRLGSRTMAEVSSGRGRAAAWARLGQRKKQWTQQRDIDAWLIWNIWQVANADVAQVVALEKEFRIYRDAGVVVTQRGKQNPAAQSFVDFLESADGRRIFAKWG